jgi:xylulose-5-phosphate/fructose-6-phosphate phosphoketolase
LDQAHTRARFGSDRSGHFVTSRLFGQEVTTDAITANVEEFQRAQKPPEADELRKIDAYWRAANYLCLGMLYLRHNPLLREPLKPEHIKRGLLGHWGSEPGQTFV